MIGIMDVIRVWCDGDITAKVRKEESGCATLTPYDMADIYRLHLESVPEAQRISELALLEARGM